MSEKQNRPAVNRAAETISRAAGVSKIHSTPFSVSEELSVWIARARRQGDHRLARFLTAWLILRGSRDG
ncbi:MAG TPA: hypothetical protein VJL59_21845 [Anaerolineales bacterium]|nr:hypothetical protein [Anaerolineales bacterium]